MNIKKITLIIITCFSMQLSACEKSFIEVNLDNKGSLSLSIIKENKITPAKESSILNIHMPKSEFTHFSSQKQTLIITIIVKKFSYELFSQHEANMTKTIFEFIRKVNDQQ